MKFSKVEARAKKGQMESQLQAQTQNAVMPGTTIISLPLCLWRIPSEWGLPGYSGPASVGAQSLSSRGKCYPRHEPSVLCCCHCPLNQPHVIWLMLQRYGNTGECPLLQSPVPQCDFKVFFIYFTHLFTCLFPGVLSFLSLYWLPSTIFLYRWPTKFCISILCLVALLNFLIITFKENYLAIPYQQSHYHLKCLISSPCPPAPGPCHVTVTVWAFLACSRLQRFSICTIWFWPETWIHYYVKQVSIHSCYYPIPWYFYWNIKTETSVVLHPFIQNIWKSTESQLYSISWGFRGKPGTLVLPCGTYRWMYGRYSTESHSTQFTH